MDVNHFGARLLLIYMAESSLLKGGRPEATGCHNMRSLRYSIHFNGKKSLADPEDINARMQERSTTVT